jgi:hypothetical protein
VVLSSLKKSLAAVGCAIVLSGVGLSAPALAQAPANHGAWPDRDADGRRAPMPFSRFHTLRLTFDQVADTLTAAGCKREETGAFIRFDCEASPKQWYLTRPGKPEHPGLAVAADKEPSGSSIAHARMLTEMTLALEEPPPERREAFQLWRKSLPLYRERPDFAVVKRGPVDLDAALKDAPISREQMSAFSFEDVVRTLEAAAGCKRGTGETYISFDCPASKTRWYVTREGQAAHRSMALKIGRTHHGAQVDEPYLFVLEKGFPATPLTGSGLIADGDNRLAWTETLPGESPGRGFPFSLAGSPFGDQDIAPRGRISASLTYDIALQKLTGAGCARKDAGEYLSFTCKDSKLLFVLSAPASSAHAAMIIAEPDPSGGGIASTFHIPFVGRTSPPQEWADAFTKWTRGLRSVPLSQLR